MQDILNKIVSDNRIHAKWLNSLSFMENMGARKISASESTELVGIIQLKHAAEEHRHAYYLKRQIAKLQADSCAHYTFGELVAPMATRQYLHRLDMQTSRYIKTTFNLSDQDLKYASYLFVTYAIEVRADILYPIYQEVLSAHASKVTVKSIILEEEGHLEEMIVQLRDFDQDWEKHAQHILTIEEALFQRWSAGVRADVLSWGG